MNWQSFPQFTPDHSGIFVISISIPNNNGNYTFNYVAYYNADSNLWFKHDSFRTNFPHTEQITNHVNGWIDNMTTYFG